VTDPVYFFFVVFGLVFALGVVFAFALDFVFALVTEPRGLAPVHFLSHRGSGYRFIPDGGAAA
jgi:hypothetical protein